MKIVVYYVIPFIESYLSDEFGYYGGIINLLSGRTSSANFPILTFARNIYFNPEKLKAKLLL